MKTTYQTTILGFGNHASIEIPAERLAELGGNKRAPLRVTVNGHTYQSTAVVMDGVCMVVFPMRDRKAAHANSGDTLMVTLELDDGYRQVNVPTELANALKMHNLRATYDGLNYSTRKEYARQVREAKADDTKQRRIAKILDELNEV